MKTIAQQLNVKEFPFIIKDSKENYLYYESVDSWEKRNYDESECQTYFETSSGFWWKKEFDKNKNQIYYEDSNGLIVDNRPKDVVLTMDEIAEKFNIPVEQLKIKKQ